MPSEEPSEERRGGAVVTARELSWWGSRRGLQRETVFTEGGGGRGVRYPGCKI